VLVGPSNVITCMNFGSHGRGDFGTVGVNVGVLPLADGSILHLCMLALLLPGIVTFGRFSQIQCLTCLSFSSVIHPDLIRCFLFYGRTSYTVLLNKHAFFMFSFQQQSKSASVALISHVHLISCSFILQVCISQFLLRGIAIANSMSHVIIAIRKSCQI
jgi:hypothetical protein